MLLLLLIVVISHGGLASCHWELVMFNKRAHPPLVIKIIIIIIIVVIAIIVVVAITITIIITMIVVVVVVVVVLGTTWPEHLSGRARRRRCAARSGG